MRRPTLQQGPQSMLFLLPKISDPAYMGNTRDEYDEVPRAKIAMDLSNREQKIYSHLRAGGALRPFTTPLSARCPAHLRHGPAGEWMSDINLYIIHHSMSNANTVVYRCHHRRDPEAWCSSHPLPVPPNTVTTKNLTWPAHFLGFFTSETFGIAFLTASLKTKTRKYQR